MGLRKWLGTLPDETHRTVTHVTWMPLEIPILREQTQSSFLITMLKHSILGTTRALGIKRGLGSDLPSKLLRTQTSLPSSGSPFPFP